MMGQPRSRGAEDFFGRGEKQYVDRTRLNQKRRGRSNATGITGPCGMFWLSCIPSSKAGCGCGKNTPGRARAARLPTQSNPQGRDAPSLFFSPSASYPLWQGLPEALRLIMQEMFRFFGGCACLWAVGGGDDWGEMRGGISPMCWVIWPDASGIYRPRPGNPQVLFSVGLAVMAGRITAFRRFVRRAEPAGCLCQPQPCLLRLCPG